MTLEEIRESKKMFLKPTDVASVLHMSPQGIRVQGRNGKLPFATMTSGNRVYILRQSFLDYIGG